MQSEMAMVNSKSFEAFFFDATGQSRFGFQEKFALNLPEMVQVPTGLGKTAMAVVGWLWRRFGNDEKLKESTPRRLVYCLPMRVLVEQSAKAAEDWISNLKRNGFIGQDVPIQILMGGEDENEWDIYPEREAILVGTQDMLLSRALNRGYAASRSRWPIQFGLLHTDCLWVFDEIQLMGAGLATTTQLEAFRRILPAKEDQRAKVRHGCRSVWMSATMRKEWLETVDFRPFLQSAASLVFDFEKELGADGLAPDARKALENRYKAKKALAKAKAAMGNAAEFADEILNKHKPGTRTIVVVNTVKRASELFKALNNAAGDSAPKGMGKKKAGQQGATASPHVRPKTILLHSRFRPGDRANAIKAVLAPPPPEGTVVVSTQVIEAGVDVSAATLFTELAPWASLVQRFGRCNRKGEDNDARVFWVDLPSTKADTEKIAPPYDVEDMKASAEQLKRLVDAGPKSLPQVELSHEHTHVIRRKDLIDLFDTTPDLAGNDIDIDRFVREIEGSDVRVFWRAWDRPKGHEPPPEDEHAPRREELCNAPVGEFRDFAKKKKHIGKVWRWNFLDGQWEKADASSIAPGQIFLVHTDAGGYTAERGWYPSSLKPVAPITNSKNELPDATEADPLSRIGVWQTLAQHTNEVCGEMNKIIEALSLSPTEAKALSQAARWHDRGKAHEVFQTALPCGAPEKMKVWAKAAGEWRRYSRRHFRHELASSLAVLLAPETLIPSPLRDLAAYLVAAHHGKVRLSIRSLPNEVRPDSGRRFARGIWDGDSLPQADLGGGVIAPEVGLSLEPMELGLCEQEPFAGQPSWAERMLHLRDQHGPFRLAYLEAVLRAADMRASRNAEEREAARQSSKTAPEEKEAARG